MKRGADSGSDSDGSNGGGEGGSHPAKRRRMADDAEGSGGSSGGGSPAAEAMRPPNKFMLLPLSSPGQPSEWGTRARARVCKGGAAKVV